jgi:hypothetical protein
MIFCSSLFISCFSFLCLGKDTGHAKCKKYQLFLYEEFSRMFKMYLEMREKETATSEKLLRALEKCDELEIEVENLKDELSEYQLYDLDF